ncbi:MAG: type I restriction enzyme HsdR N-terminal domain-containing protein [Phycisphaeraceae bacterium]|nr:type I restriction enzyme HsdR N-terminal domain-containing protein [Phycisphaeraceae bacterium]
MDDDEFDFRAALQEVVNECRRIGYNPIGFMGMVTSSNAFEAVRTLLAKREPSEGFTTLWGKKRLDLTVEAIVLKPEWRSFFTPSERDTARRRLAAAQYRAPWDDDEQPVIDNAQIESLLKELVASKGDRSAGKRIRTQLRKLGYHGGLRSRDINIERGGGHAVVPNATSVTAVPTILPPVSNPEGLLARIRSVAGLPERNHEDVVKDFLVALGFRADSIVFQQGRIDLCVLTQDRKTAAIFEVKRTIAVESERTSARRQGMDYAMQTGALIVVVTDGDRYEIYDRRKGHEYETMLSGKFQLSAYREADTAFLDLLRPEQLCSTRM